MPKNDVSHGLTVSPPNRDKLTIRTKPLITLNLILSLSKDELVEGWGQFSTLFQHPVRAQT